MTQSNCAAQMLACGPSCRVERCQHGVVHLSLGNVTVRLSPHQLIEAAEALTKAACRLGAAPQGPQGLLC